MEDFERYGDYDDKDYDKERKSGGFALFLKICIYLVCIAVVLVLGFRIVLSKSYPDSMKNIYFSDSISEYYNENGGELNAVTQSLRTPYDNAKFANFMCDNLIIVEGAGALQLSVRYNDSMINEAEKKYSLTGLSASDENLLSFRLVDNNGKIYANLVYKHYEESFMYNYLKLAFEGVDISRENKSPEWIRLEVFINAAESETPFAMIPVYENHEGYNVFSTYTLSEREKPKND